MKVYRRGSPAHGQGWQTGRSAMVRVVWQKGRSKLVRGMSMAGLAISMAACGHAAQLAVSAGTGPHPTLPEPRTSLIPTVKVAEAIGWKNGAVPAAAPDLTLTRFAAGLDHPRWLFVLPNGDVLVSETNAPSRPDEKKGIRAWFMGKFMKKAGAAVPSANRITLLRDADGDGIAETRYAFREGLNSPFGIALTGGNIYVAATDAVIRFPYTDGMTRLTGIGETIVVLPAGTRNHHWTKNIIASSDGVHLYVSVGSNSNVAENGMDVEKDRASIWEVDVATGDHRIYASGLRNPVGMTWEPTSHALWVAVNERDELGSDLVPDYMTAVRRGGFYGWPYSYYGQHVDTRVEPQRPDLVAGALAPDYALGPHTASLGLAAADGAASMPDRFKNGMFVGQHGSWNRTPRSGYKVIFVPFAAGKPNGDPVDVLTGFLNEEGEAHGRPVGIAMDRKGALLVADDVGNSVWRLMTPGGGAR